MLKKLIFLLIVAGLAHVSKAQSLLPSAPDYNAPYDTLLARGDKGTSFLGAKKYQLADVPKPMMNQIYKSAIAFLAVAPQNMAQENSNAKILGYSFKLAMDNKDLFLKYNENNVDRAIDANVKVWEEILQPVQATNNAPLTAGLYNNLINHYFNKKDYVNLKDYATKATVSRTGRY